LIQERCEKLLEQVCMPVPWRERRAGSTPGASAHLRIQNGLRCSSDTYIADHNWSLRQPDNYANVEKKVARLSANPKRENLSDFTTSRATTAPNFVHGVVVGALVRLSNRLLNWILDVPTIWTILYPTEFSAIFQYRSKQPTRWHVYFQGTDWLRCMLTERVDHHQHAGKHNYRRNTKL
jgi:hypothetical protein